MFNRENLSALFKANPRRNFILKTNISVGHGINGVSFKEFYGRNEWQNRNAYNKPIYHRNSKVVDFTDGYVTIHTDVRTDKSFETGVFVDYIPYECIVGVSFIMQSERFGVWV